MATAPAIPQGTLKKVHIDEIIVGKRFRQDYGDIDALAESIKEKGLLQPITVSTKLDLMAGGRRLQACIKAGLKTIPVLMREADGELDLREVELIENLFREDFTWDERCALVQEIDRLYRQKDISWSMRKTAQLLNKSLGNVNQYLQLAKAFQVIPELKDCKTADEAFKTLKSFENQAIIEELRSRQATAVASGQGLEKGIAAMLKRADANYMIGDTFKGLAELRKGLVQVIECDPPYGINLNENKRSKESPTSNVHTYNEVPTENYQAFLDKLTKELFRVADENAWLFFWFGPTWFTEVKTSLKGAGWLVDDIPGIWVKHHGQTMQPETYLARGYEPFFICRKGVPAIMKRGRLNVFDFAGVPGAQKIHPTERPVELIQEILETFTIPTSTILVPFLGSGNTIRAGYNLGMKVFGWDISGEYKDKFMLAVEEDARTINGEEDEED